MDDYIIVSTWVTVIDPVRHTSSIVQADLHYDADEPYEVTMIFPDDVTWRFSLELLEQGRNAARTNPAGIGDVRVWRESSAAYVVDLRSPEGRVRIFIPSNDFGRFMDYAYRAYRPAPEVDDESLAELMDEWGGAAA